MLKLLASVLVAVGWLIPNHYPPWVMFYNEAATAFGLFVLAVDPSSWQGRRGLCACAWVVLALVIVPWVQWFTGLLVFSGDAWMVSFYLGGLAVALQVGYEQARVDARRLAALLAATTLAAGFASSVLAINQIFQTTAFGIWSLDGSAGMRATANLAQPNNLATLIGFASLSLLILREQGRLSPVPSIAILSILLLAGGLTQSRSALAFGPLIILATWFFKRRGVPIKTHWLALTGATACHWLFTAVWPILQDAIFSSAPLTLTDRGVASARFQVWPLLVDALSMSPWHGYGWLQVGAAELAAAERHAPVGELWMQGHNLFLELLIWCGYPLGILLCALVCYWGVSRLLKISSVEAAIGWMTVAVLGIHAMLELPYHYIYFLFPAGLWGGLIEASVDSPPRLNRRWSFALVASTFVLGCALAKDYPKLEDAYRLMRFEGLHIGSIHASEAAPDAPFLSQLTALLRSARAPAVAGMSAEQMADMKAVAERFPYSGSLLRYGCALALNGRPQEGQLMFLKLRTIYGQEMYNQVRFDLRERVANADPRLLSLEKSLPD